MFPGFLGMPRSIYTYEPDRGWNGLNFWISMGGMIQGIAVLIFACEPGAFVLQGEEGGERSVGCMDAGVGGAFAAAGV